jgi:hypothetical protein
MKIELWAQVEVSVFASNSLKRKRKRKRKIFVKEYICMGLCVNYGKIKATRTDSIQQKTPLTRGPKVMGFFCDTQVRGISSLGFRRALGLIFGLPLQHKSGLWEHGRGPAQRNFPWLSV